MRKEEKNQVIDSLKEQLNAANIFYLTDIDGLNVQYNGQLRRLCFKKDIKLQVVKNTLLKKAMEHSDKNFEELYEALKGPTSIMFTDAANEPAKLIKEFTKKHKKDKPVLKAAYVEEVCYVGKDQLDFLISIKSKNELIADVIALLQSPSKNIISALQSGGQKLSGILETLSDKES